MLMITRALLVTAVPVAAAISIGCSSSGPSTEDPTGSPPHGCTLAPTGTASPPTADEVRAWVLAYKGAHPGNGGKDWDINTKTSSELASDPDAARLLRVCGADQRPVIPLIAWEYGGADHSWIAPEMSALVYCVYTPVTPGADHWSYNAAKGRVMADVYVLFPGENPCRDRQGADLVAGCIGDPTNFEVLVDIASYADGACASQSLAEASTTLSVVLPDGTKTLLLENL